MFSNLSLDNYFFPEIVVRENPDFDPSVKNLMADIGIERSVRRHQSDPERYLVELRVTARPREGKDRKCCPIIADVKVRGHFRFGELPKTEEDTAKFIMLNAVAILYGLIRAQVAQITSMGPHGRFILPAVNFSEMLGEEIKKAKKSRKKGRGGAARKAPGKKRA